MSENANQEIKNYLELVERRKTLRFNKELPFWSDEDEEELQRIDKQIKDAEWRLMRTLFYMSECYDSNWKSMSQPTPHFNLQIIADIAVLTFYPPSPTNFREINAILNKNNLKDMTNAFVDLGFEKKHIKVITFCNPTLANVVYQTNSESLSNLLGLQAILTYINRLQNVSNEDKETIKKEFAYYISNTKKLFEQIDYTNNHFPQYRQGNYYFTNQIGIFFDALRGLVNSENLSGRTSPELENWKKGTDTLLNRENSARPSNVFDKLDQHALSDDEINAYLAQRDQYKNENIDQTFSFFDYLAQDWCQLREEQKFAQAYNAATYLESRFIVCHFDGQWYESNEQPNETTRNFYMFLWRGSSRLLQNLVRYHLNVPNDLYNGAREKFRSQDFQKYVLEHPDQVNDLLFAFVFCPNEFKDKSYDEIISCANHSRYYKAIMDIDALIHEKNFYHKANCNSEALFSTLFKSFVDIDPTQDKNEIDDLLLSNELLIELSIKPKDSHIERYLYETISDLYSKPQIITGDMPLHFKITCLAAAKLVENNTKQEIDPNIFTHEPYFKLLHENCNAEILTAAYYVFKRMDELNISNCKEKVTYEMIEQMYIYKVYRDHDKLNPILSNFAQTKDPSAAIREIQTNSISEGEKEQNEKNLKPDIKPILLLISSHVPQNISTDGLRDKLNSLTPKEFNLLTEIIRANPSHLNDISKTICTCQDIHKYVNPFGTLLDKLAPEIKQTFLNFYHQDIDVFNEINKLNDNQKRLFVLMCLRKEKHFFSRDTIEVVSLDDMNTLFRCFQAIQTLDIPDTAKYEMTKNICDLYLTTPCKEIDPDFLVAAIFKEDLIYQLTNNPAIRNEFINAPDEFLSSYNNKDEKTDENQKLSFINRRGLAQLAQNNIAANKKIDSLQLEGMYTAEKNFYQQYYLALDGNRDNLPDELKSLRLNNYFKCSRLPIADRRALMQIAQNAIKTNAQIEPKNIVYYTNREEKYFIRYFLSCGGKLENLPTAWQKSATAKEVSQKLNMQENCVPKVAENETRSL